MNLWEDSPHTPQRSRAVTWATLAAVCIITYLRSLSFDVTNLDDDILIINNLAFLSHFPNITTVFTTDAFYLKKSIDLYRPLQSATFILDAQWGADTVAVAHCTNLMLHILSCLTLYTLLRLLDFREQIAFLGALIFAVHYLFMTAVAWLPARGDLLLGLFAFLTLVSFIKLLARGGWRNYFVHTLCFTCALFSKESAVMLPALLALYLWAYGKIPVLTRHHLILPGGYLAVSLGYFRLKSLSVMLYQGDIGLHPLIKNIRYLPETVAKFYLPLNMSTLPAYKLTTTAAGVVIVAALVGIHLRYRDKCDRRVLFYAGWVLLLMVPGMLYYPAFYYFTYEHLDHRSYVTCFGLLLLTLNLVQIFELDSMRYFKAICVLVLVYLAVCNIYFSRSYRNPSEFALQAIRTNPNSADAYAIYGKELYLQGRDAEALDNLNRSIHIFRKYTPALHTRAQIYRKRGQLKEAQADLDTIISFDPGGSVDSYLLRAQVRIDLQDYDGALRDYLTAARLNPGDAEADKGIKELQRTVRNNRLLPQVSAAQQLNQQGIEAGERRDFPGAEALFRRALATDPGFYGVNLNLGKALYEQGRKSEACVAWRVAAEHGSDIAGELLKEHCAR